MLDGEQADEDPGNKDRYITDGLGKSEGGNRAVTSRNGHLGTAGEQGHCKYDGKDIDNGLTPEPGFFGKDRNQRIQANVPGVPHACRSAEHGHRNHQQQGDLLDIRRGVIEYIAQDDTIDDDSQQPDQA